MYTCIHCDYAVNIRPPQCLINYAEGSHDVLMMHPECAARYFQRQVGFHKTQAKDYLYQLTRAVARAEFYESRARAYRDALIEAKDAMDDRRNYAEGWEWKYTKAWDLEEAEVQHFIDLSLEFKYEE